MEPPALQETTAARLRKVEATIAALADLMKTLEERLRAVEGSRGAPAPSPDKKGFWESW